MAFNSLSDKLKDILKNLKKKGKLSEDDVKLCMKEVKMALLEADVNFKIVKDFVKTVSERAVGQEVLNGLNTSQMVVKIVNEELTNLMGSTDSEIVINRKELSTIMMIGLQGAGKTTTTAKLAGIYKKKGKKVLLVALDVYRPAAIEQLQINGKKQGVEVFSEGKEKPLKIALDAMDYATKKNFDIVIFDTAGRLQIDEDMMNELKSIRDNINLDNIILVVDSMTGQEAVTVASTFDEQIGISGVIFTKLDGDTRGGAVLSIKAVTGKPIFYIGTGEKMDALEKFYPDRMANRILGMGDVLSLIDKVSENIDEEKAKDITKKVVKDGFDFNDYLEAMEQMNKMGGFMSILSMLPGMSNSKMSEIEGAIDEKKMARISAIVYSMTPKERANPKLLNGSRRKRIANGCGLDVSEVNRFIKQFEQSSKMMKNLPNMMGKKNNIFKNFGLF